MQCQKYWRKNIDSITHIFLGRKFMIDFAHFLRFWLNFYLLTPYHVIKCHLNFLILPSTMFSIYKKYVNIGISKISIIILIQLCIQNQMSKVKCKFYFLCVRWVKLNVNFIFYALNALKCIWVMGLYILLSN